MFDTPVEDFHPSKGLQSFVHSADLAAASVSEACSESGFGYPGKRALRVCCLASLCASAAALKRDPVLGWSSGGGD